MPDSFQKEKPPSRVNLFLELKGEEATEKVELPLRVLVVGDFSEADQDVPMDEREVVSVNSDNFESVMASSQVKMEYLAEDRLSGEEGEEILVRLDVDRMASFEPEHVAEQIPQVRRMVAVRNLLQDLRNRVVSMRDFRKRLSEIVQDEEALSKLSEELDRLVVASDAPEPPAREATGGASDEAKNSL